MSELTELVKTVMHESGRAAHAYGDGWPTTTGPFVDEKAGLAVWSEEQAYSDGSAVDVIYLMDRTGEYKCVHQHQFPRRSGGRLFVTGISGGKIAYSFKSRSEGEIESRELEIEHLP